MVSADRDRNYINVARLLRRGTGQRAEAKVSEDLVAGLNCPVRELENSQRNAVRRDGCERICTGAEKQ